MCVMQVGTLIQERSHKYFELKLWASENAPISAHVSLDMSRKAFGGWGFAPDPDWGLISPRPLIFKRRGQRLSAIETLETRAPVTVLRLWLIVYRTELTVSLSVGGARGMAGGSCPLCPSPCPCPSSCPHSKS